MMPINWDHIKRDMQSILQETRGHLSPPQLAAIDNFAEVGEHYLALDSLCEFLSDNEIEVPASVRKRILQVFRDLELASTDHYERMLGGPPSGKTS